MSYTVKQLADLSGVSVRTLHYYDEIGLLKPAFHSESGYRQYEEEQLLILQQILFFKELDFPLKEIKRIVGKGDFDKFKSLTTQKKVLLKRLDRTKKLIKTIDKTLLHLRGKIEMQDQELYYGFDSARQKGYEDWLKTYLEEEKGINPEPFFAESRKRTRHWKKEDWENYKQEGDQLNREFAEALEKGLRPDSNEVQALVERHFHMIERFYTPTKEVYIGLGELYCEHPDFGKFFKQFHPELAPFLAETMKVYAEEHLC